MSNITISQEQFGELLDGVTALLEQVKHARQLSDAAASASYDAIFAVVGQLEAMFTSPEPGIWNARDGEYLTLGEWRKRTANLPDETVITMVDDTWYRHVGALYTPEHPDWPTICVESGETFDSRDL